MKISASLTIGRGSDDLIRIRIKDEASRVQFAMLSISPHDFAMAVTGLSEIKVDCECNGLDHVGKQKIIEPRTAVYKVSSIDKAFLSAWILENRQEKGWSINSYLGSQGSVTSTDGGMLLRYAVYKYVDEQQKETT